MTTLTLYDIDTDVRRAATADCDTCHGEPFLDAVSGQPCPDCDGNADELMARNLAPLRPEQAREVEAFTLALGMVLKELEAEADMLEAHASAITERAKTRRRRSKSLKTFMQLGMEAAGLSKVKNGYLTVYLSDSRESIEITDIDKVPREYQRATLKLPANLVPEALATYVVGTDVLKTPLLELLHQDGLIVDGTSYQAKGATKFLVVRS